MFVDGRSLARDQQIETDVCVIGAGAAGITLAHELSGARFAVALIESGGLAPDERAQALYSGPNVGHPYQALDTVRLRYFGGSTNHWGGHCLPIRALSFEKRDWIPHSGWPISRKTLDPFYRRAHEIIGLGPFDYDPAALSRRTGQPLFPFDASRLVTVVSRYNALRFGEAYRDPISKAPNLTTFLHSNVVSINRSRRGDLIDDVAVRTLAGNDFTVRARHFVLATGGLENARLLLLSNDVQAAGLGNQNDLVGRFFMDHIWYPNGFILPIEQEGFHDLYTRSHTVAGDVPMKANLALPDAVVRRERIPDYRAELAPIRRHLSSTSDVGPLGAGAKSDLGPDLAKMLKGIRPRGESGPSPSDLRKYRVLNFSEQVPNPDSRVTLTNDKDELGCPRIALDWRLTELDKRGVRRAQRLIALEVGRSGFGRFESQLPEDAGLIMKTAVGGSHHMGTTRLGDDPRTSVVDADGRVHGLRNLFVAGSSVFPSCGYANPTLTIVALAVRLAGHIQKQYTG